MLIKKKDNWAMPFLFYSLNSDITRVIQIVAMVDYEQSLFSTVERKHQDARKLEARRGVLYRQGDVA